MRSLFLYAILFTFLLACIARMLLNKEINHSGVSLIMRKESCVAVLLRTYTTLSNILRFSKVHGMVHDKH